MTLQEIIADIHALSKDLEAYKRRYGVLSETLAGIIERTARHDTNIPYFWSYARSARTFPSLSQELLKNYEF